MCGVQASPITSRMEAEGKASTSPLPLHVYEDRSSHRVSGSAARTSQSSAAEAIVAQPMQQDQPQEGAAVAPGDSLAASGIISGQGNVNPSKKRPCSGIGKAVRKAEPVSPPQDSVRQQQPAPVAPVHQCNDRDQRGAGPWSAAGKRARRAAAHPQHSHLLAVTQQHERVIGRNWWEGIGSRHVGDAGALHMDGAAPAGMASSSSAHEARCRTGEGIAAAHHFSGPQHHHHPDSMNGRPRLPFDAGLPAHGIEMPLHTQGMQAHVQSGAGGQMYQQQQQQRHTPALQQPWFPPDPAPVMPGYGAPCNDADGHLWMDEAGIAMPPKQAQPALSPQQLNSNVVMQLHQEVEAFACRAAPTQVEVEAVQAAAQIVRESALELWPECTVGLFGSQAASLALPGSDIDITILGVPHIPVSEDATGLSKKKREHVAQELRRLLKLLKKRKLVIGFAQTIPARVPIIKCYLAVSPDISIAADISLGVGNGPLAVPFILQQVETIGPSLRSLTLVMKALLKQARLNDRASGGLGSYCLLNLIIAHLQAEGVQVRTPANMGQLLLSLLLRFGKDFDYAHKAVSFREGGFMTKIKAWRQKKNLHLLAVEDPQQEGRDIGAGAFNILEVKRCLGDAYDALHMCCAAAAEQGMPKAQPSWAAVQAEGQSRSVNPFCSSDFPLLDCIINTSLEIGRAHV